MISNLGNLTDYDLIEYGLEALIVDRPGRCLVSEYLKENKDDVRKYMLKILPTIVNDLPQFFPKSGIVRRLGTYNYIELNDNGYYTDNLASVLNVVESTYGYSKLLPGHQLSPIIKVVPPPSPANSHITISPNIDDSWLGRTIDFKLDIEIGVVIYPEEHQGSKPTIFDLNISTISWYLLYVKGIPLELLRDYSIPPHISIAMLAYVHLEIEH